MSLIALAIGLGLLAVTHSPAGSSSSRAGDRPGDRVSGRAIRAVDGDTAVVRIDGRQDETVRYIGIDTPESVKPDTPVQCFGHEASLANARMIEGRRVELGFGAERRDVYGRLLAYVHRGKRFINASLMRRGYARTLEIAPNTDHAALFDRLQRSAASRGIGLWSAC